MKSEPRIEQQGTKGPKAANGSGANANVNLAKLSSAELLALAQRRNKQNGLSVPDVLAPVFRGVVDTASVRPPSVHPFTVGGGGRKDQYRAAWKALSKRIGVPLFSTNDTEANNTAATATTTTARPEKEKTEPKAGGGSKSAAAAAAAAGAAGGGPTHAQLYGSASDHSEAKAVAENDKFVKLLGSWLGLAGPPDLPLLAPGAPPLLLKKLFREVLESGGSAAVSWPALAGRHVGDPLLAGVLKQVYDAYLAPAEQRIAASGGAGGGAPGAAGGGGGSGAGAGKRTRAVRWEDVLNADVKRRAQLPEGTVPSIDKVLARVAVARAAIRVLEPARVAAAAATASVAVKQDVGMAVDAAAPSSSAQQQPAVDAPAPEAASPHSTLAADVLRAVRQAAAQTRALLEGGGGGAAGGKDAGGSKKRRASTARRQSKGVAAAAAAASSARKRARGSAAAADLEDSGGGEAAVAGAEVDEADVAAAVAADGEPLGSIEPRVAALLSVAASLKQTHAAPPGFASLPLPDLRANFMARWEAARAARAGKDAAKAETDAGAAAHGGARRGSDTADGGGGTSSRKRQRKAEDEAGAAAAAAAAAKTSKAAVAAAAAAAAGEEEDPLISGPPVSRQSSQQLLQLPAVARPTNSGSGAEAAGATAGGAAAGAAAAAPKAAAGSGLPPLPPRSAVIPQPAAAAAAAVAGAQPTGAAPAAVTGSGSGVVEAVEVLTSAAPVPALGAPASAVAVAVLAGGPGAAAEAPLAAASVLEEVMLVEATGVAGGEPSL